jgi:hypothetical protein
VSNNAQVVASISLVELAGRLRALDTAAAAQPVAQPARKAPGPHAATRAPAKKTTRPAKTTSPRKADTARTTSAPAGADPLVLTDATATTPQATSVATDATGSADRPAQQQLASVAG